VFFSGSKRFPVHSFLYRFYISTSSAGKEVPSRAGPWLTLVFLIDGAESDGLFYPEMGKYNGFRMVRDRGRAVITA